jgi:protein-disulfide isomerase
MILAAHLTSCVSPTPPLAVEKNDTTTATPQRSSRGSGMSYRDGSVPVIGMAYLRVSLEGEPRLGDPKAKIGIVEFSDYQCPYCSQFHNQIFPRLVKEYVDTGVVQFIFKDLPLQSIHPQAMNAALAANCAGEQNKFWPMHEALFTNHGLLAPALYYRLAREFSMDENKFSACLRDPARERAIMRDVSEARRLGITGTPSFVIGKIEGNEIKDMRIARGLTAFEAFAQVIENLRAHANPDATSKTE